MHHPTLPVTWQDIAASYDPRGLPFLRFYQEAGLLESAGARSSTILVQAAEQER